MQELERLRETVDPAGERWGGRATIGEELQHAMDRFAAMQPTGEDYPASRLFHTLRRNCKADRYLMRA